MQKLRLIYYVKYRKGSGQPHTTNSFLKELGLAWFLNCSEVWNIKFPFLTNNYIILMFRTKINIKTMYAIGNKYFEAWPVWCGVIWLMVWSNFNYNLGGHKLIWSTISCRRTTPNNEKLIEMTWETYHIKLVYNGLKYSNESYTA